MKNTNVKIFEGEVREALPNTMFKIVLTDGRVLLATLTGRMRRRFVRIFPGDRVKIEMTEYDVDRGRIVYKF
ncbi:translation initiation factor IF-1 [soil metagenome]